MNPYTGEILAEASYPSYDGNDYAAIAASDPNRFIDPIVSSVYEPGSVFKMLTVRRGPREATTVTTQTRINDTGILKLDGGRTHVDDADHKAMGWMTFEDAIAYSRNVVAAKVALGLDKTTEGRVGDPPLDVDPVRVRQPDRDRPRRRGRRASSATRRSTPWRQIDLANGAFGQGVAVTPLQLATAYAAMMNGGQRDPAARRPGRRRQRPRRSAPKGQVIDAGALEDAVGMMNHVVTTVPFYRDRTLIPGYDVGGKTGTAQIWDPKAERRPRRLEAQHLQLLVRRLHRPAERVSRTSSSRSGSRRGRRPSPSSASSRCR